MTDRVHPLLFSTLVLLTTMAAIAASLGAPLVPEIAALYDVSLGDAQWSLTVTLLVGAASTPVLGRLASSRHRNTIVLGGLAAVALGGLLCALPLGVGWFFAGRGLQGLGYGLTPVAIAIARVSLPAEKRAGAVALLSVTSVAGAGLGYPIASMSVEVWGLHRTFLAGAVLCLACLVLAVFTLPQSPQVAWVPVDWIGTLLLSGGTTAALLGLAESRSGSVLFVVTMFVVAALCWCAWVPWNRRQRHPIVDLALALRPVPVLAHATSFLVGVGVYLLLPLMIVVVQDDVWGLGHGPAVAGWLILPYALVSVLGSRVGLQLARVVDRLLLLPLGCVTYLISFVWVTVLHEELWQLIVAMLIAGLGSGLALAAIPSLLVSAVPATETGSSLAFNMVVRYLGFSLGSTLALFILTFGGEPNESAFTDALLASCGVGVLMVGVSTLLARRAMRLRG